MKGYRDARISMVKSQLLDHGIRDRAVLAAMGQVPRELFVPARYRNRAYTDAPLPIPAGQTISQPYVVAYMLSLLALQPDMTALEIGCGSGYAAAVMSRIVAQVHAIERHQELVTYARQRLAHAGYDNVAVHHGDGTAGLLVEAPFDAILVSAGGPRVPLMLREQLAVGGRLVIPVGRHRHSQVLRLVKRMPDDTYRSEDHGLVAFVPLIGDQGWRDDEIIET